MDARSHTAQMSGSLLVAVAIVVVTVIAVTARLGPTSAAELEAREERTELRIEREEKRRDALEELREER